MRHVVTLFVAIRYIASETAAAFQTRSGGPAAGQPTVRACAVQTRDLVAPLTENKKILDLIPPQRGGTRDVGHCMPARRRPAAVVPGTWWETDKVSAKDFQPISGAGEGGFLRNNRDRYAELMVWTGKHSLNLQVSVPSRRTPPRLSSPTSSPSPTPSSPKLP